MSRILERAREVFDIEIAGIEAVKNGLGADFEKLVEMCAGTIGSGGKLILTGIGKSGYIGKKMAATLSSVGTPSIFMHPVEARHGDLGMIQKNDLMIALSYSGETDELLVVLPAAKQLGVKLVGITSSRNSSLGKVSDLVVEMPVPREACPFNLAPTTTTTALLVLGDALAMVLLEKQGFTKEDYGRRHPGGAIGRMITMCAADVMRSLENSALVSPEASVRETLYAMSHARCGSAIVVDGAKHLLGIFTDGDFRRWAEKEDRVLELKMRDVMTKNPISVAKDTLIVSVLKLIKERKVDDLVVIDANNVVQGFIDSQDLPGFKMM